jgi:hypothetical protein
MRAVSRWSPTAALASAALWMALGSVAPSSATSLIRQSLDELVANNSAVVLGEVVEVNSRWNDEGSFILSDVTFAASEVLKGRLAPGEFTLTVMGGSVGELTTLIVGGAELVPGRAYVLFLAHDDLPGAARALTVRDHSQGAFDVVRGRAGDLRAVSQASRQPLVPDARGDAEAAGGAEGMSLDSMTRAIRTITSRPAEAN